MNNDATAMEMAHRWLPPGDLRLAPAHGGHINASYFVSDGSAPPRWLLQRLNSLVFPYPHLVMRNIEHLLTVGATQATGVQLPKLLRALSGEAWVRDAAGELWRCWEVTPGLRSTTRVAGVLDARETGRAFGAFAAMTTILDPGLFSEPIPGFHDSPARLARFEHVVAADPLGRAEQAREEIALALRYRALAPLLIEPLRQGLIPTRVAHNDAKIANVLFDQATGHAVMVIDLDTVMPGTPLFDFGDLVRSSVSEAEEDATDPAQVHAEPVLYKALLDGYLNGVSGMLTAGERDLLEPAGRVITWEQAIRFLTDYLEGDVYFATVHREHNLVRARAQLALLGSLDAHREELTMMSRRW